MREFVTLIFLFFALSAAQKPEEPSPKSDNVCTIKYQENTTIHEPYKKLVPYREEYRCGFLRLETCYRTKYKEITQYRDVVETQTNEAPGCCEGFGLELNTRMCIAMCDPPCNRLGGKCIGNDNCKCDAGYGGKTCEHKCEGLYYGPDCSQNCQCEYADKCSPDDGKCHCRPGYTGETCDTPCKDGFYGVNCEKECMCQNGGSCDRQTGKCYCPPGYSGQLCLQSCPDGMHGADCKYSCRCENGAECNSTDGTCKCRPGYKGALCEKECEDGWWGDNCTRRCNCMNQQFCDKETGVCLCMGFYGDKCEFQCARDKWGLKCEKNCFCGEHGRCDGDTGTCVCDAGYVGRTCDKRLCPAKRFSADCMRGCSCITSNMESCDPVLGKCTCKAGFDGIDCARTCSSFKFGPACNDSCNCVTENTEYCNSVDGTCVCRPGFMGDRCETPCPSGKYGVRCNRNCHCLNDAKCDSVTGACPCPEGEQCDNTSECIGSRGDKCKGICAQGTWGISCHDTCDNACKNGGRCDPHDGTCTCAAGWTGPSCEEKCPEGTWGPFCANRCECAAFEVCNAATGECTCPAGFQNRDTSCNQPCDVGYYGINCALRCSQCGDGIACHSTEGYCMCGIGRLGNNCDSICPEGNWGFECQYTCPANCTRANGHYCHHAYGCCADGEARCLVDPVTGKVYSTSSVGQYAWLLILLALALLIVVVVAVHYRRKYHKEAGDVHPQVIRLKHDALCRWKASGGENYTPGTIQTGDFEQPQFDNPLYGEKDARVSMVQNGHTVQWRQRNGKPVDVDDISEIAEEEEIVKKSPLDRSLTSLPPVKTAFHENIYTEPHQTCSSQTSSGQARQWERFDDSTTDEPAYVPPSTFSRRTRGTESPPSTASLSQVSPSVPSEYSRAATVADNR